MHLEKRDALQNTAFQGEAAWILPVFTYITEMVVMAPLLGNASPFLPKHGRTIAFVANTSKFSIVNSDTSSHEYWSHRQTLRT